MMFQSPSLRGSGRFSAVERADEPTIMFQSPSLRGSGRFDPLRRKLEKCRFGFNPLHCGAVVASRHGPQPGRRCQACFNPLHCGAVVASRALGAGGEVTAEFQSPSLRGSGRFRRSASFRARASAFAFQSPSLRGSGRFFGLGLLVLGRGHPGFNPLHCGAVVASRGDARVGDRRTHVSIPFIAGQWSLRAGRSRSRTAPPVSIPFIAGQWSLPTALLIAAATAAVCFNPLHCGAVVASPHPGDDVTRMRGFNPLHCGAVVASRL